MKQKMLLGLFLFFMGTGFSGAQQDWPRALTYLEKEMYQTRDARELKALYRKLKTEYDRRYFLLAIPEYVAERKISKIPRWLRVAVVHNLKSKDPLVVYNAVNAVTALKISCPGTLMSVFKSVHVTFGSNEEMIKTAILGALCQSKGVSTDTLSTMEMAPSTHKAEAEKVKLHMKEILVAIDPLAYAATRANVTQYLNDITACDHKKAKLIVWRTLPNTNYKQCDSFWHALQNEYFSAIDSGDEVEGAVLIGNIPVPLTHRGDFSQWIPFDQVYMDIIDTRQGHPLRYKVCPFAEDIEHGNCFFGSANYNGDRHFDLWVSRINAQYLNGGIREGSNFFDEYAIYNNYLSRMHIRMTRPPTVPSRGFVMGGYSQDPPSFSLHDVLGKTMMKLKLPWLAEFPYGENSAFNWMSQLLAGPRGCINFGGFNGSLFPNERNRRYCRYDTLGTVYVPHDTVPTIQKIDPSDSLGWEWAGLGNFSCPEFMQYSGEGSGRTLDGYFGFGTVGPYWGSDYYQDTGTNPNPYNRTLGWKGKYAEWRWRVTKSNKYNIFINFENNPANCNYVEYYLQYDSLDRKGVPVHILNTMDDMRYRFSVDQRSFANNLSSDSTSPDYRWHQIFAEGLPMDSNFMAVVFTPAGKGNHPLVPGGLIRGRQIIKAIRFISVDKTVDQTISATQPTTYPDIDNCPQGIFSANGCYTSDAVDRSYEEMGDEPGGGGLSKTQFFLISAGQINNFIHCLGHVNSGDTTIHNGSPTLSKCLGTLYALGHNGLICMGTVTADYLQDSYDPFISSLARGKDFGQAFLDQQNARSFGEVYSLLGAGSLKSQPYVFGARKKLQQ